MTEFERGIINLVKSSISGEAVEIPENFDWGRAYSLALKHQIVPMIYYGIINSGIDIDAEILSKIELDTFKMSAVSTRQMYELECICKKFRENAIEYMPLKGTLLKKMYPKTEMRSMSDADVLIKTEQYDKIKPIMLDLGYQEGVESDHELVWRKPAALELELHKRLIPSYNKDYYAYFGDGWRLVQPTRSSCFELKDEDNFIYLFTHYAKHYRDGGIGIRHITDFQVFLSAKSDIDIKYIEKELKKLQLLEFYKNTIMVLKVWFEGAEDNDITDFMTSKIIGSGSYGVHEKKVISNAVKSSKSLNSNDKVRNHKIIRLIFLPYKSMVIKYPFLKKFPILLPIMWIVRWVTAITNKRGNIKSKSEDLKLITEKNISEYQSELNFVGLDFNFKE